ncbi:MAG: hypothetical protein ACI8V2_005337, partial [Candidatus Latescibacterota bacterium]
DAFKEIEYNGVGFLFCDVANCGGDIHGSFLMT